MTYAKAKPNKEQHNIRMLQTPCSSSLFPALCQIGHPHVVPPGSI